MTDKREEELENGSIPEEGETVLDDSTAVDSAEETAFEGAVNQDTDPDTDEGEVADTAEEPTEEERLKSERDEFESKWLRVVAEMDNVRKRNRRELADTRRFSQADVLRKFLDVLDNFDRALQSTPNGDDTGESDGFRAGVELIYQNFRGAMKELGVEPIEALDAEFDPNVHEAVGQLARDGVEHGIVIEVVAEGFMFGDMVLRPSRVIISS
jgi:molecular chaperone GrpE